MEVSFGRARTSVHQLHVHPDIVCDFTALPFEPGTFSLVVFDPPHLIKAKETSWLVKKYGKLDENWPQMLRDGFRECMRVLKPNGVLIFKWSEYDIPAADVWKAIGEKPLFGHHSGKKSRTFWACYMKLKNAELGPSKLIEAAVLRSKVHKMIERSEHDSVSIEFDKGFRYALSRVESLIDKMKEAACP